MTESHVSKVPVAVASRSFSKHPLLRAELLKRYSNVTFNDAGKTLAGEELFNFLKGHQKAIIGLEVLDASLMSRLPELKVIGKYGVGLDKIDLIALEKLGVQIGCTLGVNRLAVAELALSFMLNLVRLIPQLSTEMSKGVWNNRPARQLTARSVGIIGGGNVGQEVGRLLRPFHCQVLAYDIRDQAHYYKEAGIEHVSLDVLLKRSEIVSIHVPLNSSTRGFMNQTRIESMRQGAILINTARGGLVDEDVVLKQLKSGALSGAAFDVFDVEPPSKPELLSHPNFLSTPHVGGSSEEAILAMGRAAIHGLDHFSSPLDLQ